IRFPGYVTDQNLLRELYCNAFAYIHGHEFGGTNPALLKALGFGCCILALDTPFSREVLNNEQHGVYFGKQAGNLAELIARVDHDADQVAALRARSRERIVKRYNWENIANQYETVLTDLVQRRKAR